MKKLSKLVQRYRIDKPEQFRLADHDPADTGALGIDKSDAKALLAECGKRLADLQEKLFAQDHWAVLVILQAMDAAGKDSVVEHVMSGVNPQGCEVTSFKAPSAQELDHDFLWRSAINVPERGRIGIFNRSHYEETLVVRVHPELLARQKIPPQLKTKTIWEERFKSMRDFERTLALNGTVVLKFMLNVSKEEQRKRFLDRLEDPAKRWKFSMGDVAERARWDDYMHAYEETIRHTSIPEAPWHVVPADHKWFTRLVVAATLVETLERIKPDFPRVEGDALVQLEAVREALLAEQQGEGAAKPA